MELIGLMSEGIIPTPRGMETNLKLPDDNVEWFKYHCIAMQEEMGEVLQADKRWKTHRNESFNPDEKLDELADVYITMMNMAIYSGYSSDMLEDAVLKKIRTNFRRLEKKMKEVGLGPTEGGLEEYGE